jgi:hypothetical protein
VDCTQIGFIKERNITEGFIYAQQLLKHVTVHKIPLAIFKADIHKAFDTLGWDFLLTVLKELGFPINFVKWVQISVLNGSSQAVNGLLGKKLKLRRGVRQGDPILSIFIHSGYGFHNKMVQQTHSDRSNSSSLYGYETGFVICG